MERKSMAPSVFVGVMPKKNFKEFEEDFIKITDHLPAGFTFDYVIVIV